MGISREMIPKSLVKRMKKTFDEFINIVYISFQRDSRFDK